MNEAPSPSGDPSRRHEMLEDTAPVTRIGLLVPSSNAVMEVEFYRSLPADITVHTSHIYRANAAVDVSGTGVHTIGVIGALERALGKPVITANLAALWGALDHVGCADRFSFGESRLLEWQRTR